LTYVVRRLNACARRRNEMFVSGIKRP